MYFKDKRIWITGASSGIGKGLAIALFKAGAKVILSSRNEGKLKKVKKECAASGNKDNVFVLPMDISDTSAIKNKTLEAVSLCGGIDILINNAGISQRGTALETDLSLSRKIMETNFFGTVELTRNLVPEMIKAGGGQIITITSVLGKFGAPGRSTYSASKHALHGWMDSLRAEVYGKNISVTLLCPGYVQTEISKSAFESDGTAHGVIDPGQQKGITPQECAKRMLIAIERKQSEAYIGGIEAGGCYLKRFFPKIMERVIRKWKIN
jgi:short-subunit dehydrogenase